MAMTFRGNAMSNDLHEAIEEVVIRAKLERTVLTLAEAARQIALARGATDRRGDGDLVLALMKESARRGVAMRFN
ncbi:hypothetical protein VQ042_15245 [Aurantimonas sp. A2-1-M11]|uniref:hypothetical protein n=1 Tax=Aurantimonas sp. A2-1-M11 TaxID=3113712 RepID=UPI002F9540D8